MTRLEQGPVRPEDAAIIAAVTANIQSILLEHADLADRSRVGAPDGGDGPDLEAGVAVMNYGFEGAAPAFSSLGGESANENLIGTLEGAPSDETLYESVLSDMGDVMALLQK